MPSITFHGVTYEPTVMGPRDSSSAIALGFVHDSREVAQCLNEAGRELIASTRALTQGISEGCSSEDLKRLQEAHRASTRAFDDLHREWSGVFGSAQSVLHDYFTWGEGQDGG
ncbi:hypothetical protein RCO28_30210 [Streptomyces sp. LHD-70]|uniref:hypothetical protein n=1 Tax=Streptomyces sp. LHD-70 TaxID=3072140 RepID=UPI00280FCC58|nr:hypothetical protein [Streptomyces sp. LHD-70]MDQ8706716.1 hypothetical protein [Streptomyces sp. LHD-70]